MSIAAWVPVVGLFALAFGTRPAALMFRPRLPKLLGDGRPLVYAPVAIYVLGVGLFCYGRALRLNRCPKVRVIRLAITGLGL